MSARAIGDEIEILPSRKFASVSPTIEYLTLSPRILVLQRYGGAELDGVARQLGRVDDFGARNLVFEFGNARFVQALLLPWPRDTPRFPKDRHGRGLLKLRR